MADPFNTNNAQIGGKVIGFDIDHDAHVATLKLIAEYPIVKDGTVAFFTSRDPDLTTINVFLSGVAFVTYTKQPDGSWA